MSVIAISCHRFGHGGGIERYAMDLVDGLHRLGIRPLVFAKSFDTAIPEYAMVEPVTIDVRGWPGKLRDHVFARRLRALKAARGVDLLIACNRTTVSDVAVCGGTHLGHLARRGKRAGFWDRLQIRLERAHYAHARLVLAHARAMADELQACYGLAPARIGVAYPPVNQRVFTPVDAAARAALRRELGFAEDRVVFLFPSSDHVRKGLPLLADAFARTGLPVELAVLGRPLARPLPNVRHLGFRRDMENVYRAADFTILASRYEPFGLVGPESVLCGTPTVLAQGIGCVEAMSPDAVTLFDPARPDTLDAALAAAVARVRRGDGRLATPGSHLAYDPDTAAHVRAILDLAGMPPPVQD